MIFLVLQVNRADAYYSHTIYAWRTKILVKSFLKILCCGFRFPHKPDLVRFSFKNSLIFKLKKRKHKRFCLQFDLKVLQPCWFLFSLTVRVPSVRAALFTSLHLKIFICWILVTASLHRGNVSLFHRHVGVDLREPLVDRRATRLLAYYHHGDNDDRGDG